MKRSFRVPDSFKDHDSYYRSALKTEPSKGSTISQHELLYNMKNKHKFLEIYYACPMLFSTSDLFGSKHMEDESTFREYLKNQLVLVDIGKAPDPKDKTWKSFNKHHIIWKENSGNDIEWCSIPKRGTKLNLQEWMQSLHQKILDGDQLIRELKELKATLSNSDKENIFSKLTILSISDNN